MGSCKFCELLDEYVNPNFARYLGLGYINTMILLFSTLLPFLYFPTIFPRMHPVGVAMHLGIYAHLWVCLVYNYYKLVFGRDDFYNPALVDEMKVARTHFCPICKATVLKRDHHCYFYGICVGYYNLKHFIFIPYWGAVCCAYALIPFSIYYQVAYKYTPRGDLSSVFFDIMKHIVLVAHHRLPLSLVVHLVLAVVAVLNVILLPWVTLGFLYLTAVNQTTFEFTRGIRKFRKSCHRNLTESLGSYYWLLFVLPRTKSQIDYFKLPDHKLD